jgi:Tol biopolymer transport system component
MRVSRSRSLATFVGVILTIVGCDDPIEAPALGAIRVVVQASGEDVILEGLRVVIANGPTRQFGAEFELVIGGLPVGVHAVRLEGLAVNCQITSANPRSVTVVASQLTVAEFNMACAPRLGSVRVTTATTGTELDPDGYTAMVIDGPSLPVPVNGTTTVPNVREGQRMVTLGDVAANCAIAGADTVTVTVQLGATVDAAFSVQCQAAGRLEVTVSTSGVDPDPNGYVVVAQATSVNFTDSLDVAPNGSVTFSPLAPAADYRVTLRDVAVNCDVMGADVQTATVTAGVTTHVAFDVSCETPALIAIVREGDIYVIRSNGTGATRLTMDPASDGEPAWSAGGEIAFTTRRHSNDTELYVMHDDGTNPVRLTTSAGEDDAPSWSPDGGKIAFGSQRDVTSDGYPNSEIYVMNADGTGLTRLTNSDATDTEAAWSSTGKIVFVSYRDDPAGELYVMNGDGTNVVRLTDNDSTERSPAWSPDGSMIAFTREVECYYGCRHDIFVMNSDGSNVRRLATGWATYQHHSDPAWSPNGVTVAFTRQYCDYYSCDAPSIWLVEVEGTDLRQVADNAANPAWKP